jgi:G6PDH family F420-dependent oxidoreductase
VVGRGFPAVRERQALLAEALDIINLLWRGGYRSYDGRYLKLEDARVFDLPSTPPAIAVAAGGKKAAGLAATHGSGLFATEPRADLVEAFTAAGGSGPRYAEIAVSWAPTAEEAVRAAHETTRWAVFGWKVMAELPNPANFEAASELVRPEDVREKLVTGPDPEPYRAAIREYEQAGFDHIALMNVGPDPDGFLDFAAKELL